MDTHFLAAAWPTWFQIDDITLLQEKNAHQNEIRIIQIYIWEIKNHLHHYPTR